MVTNTTPSEWADLEERAKKANLEFDCSSDGETVTIRVSRPGNSFKVRRTDSDHARLRQQIDTAIALFEPKPIDPKDPHIPNRRILPSFNEPVGPDYLKAIGEIHDLCRKHQLNYELSFNDGSNSWSFTIPYGADGEQFFGKDYTLSTAMECVLGHLDGLTAKYVKLQQ